MASFKSTVITEKGHALMAKTLAGDNKMTFSKVCTSDYQYPAETDFEKLTSLKNIKQTSEISSITLISDVSVKVRSIFENTDLTEGYYVRAVGLFAIDPDEGEILYSITIANQSDWMPPNNGVSASSILIDLITVISNASNVTIEVNQNATVTIEDLKDHTDSEVASEAGIHGIRYFEEKLQFNNGEGWIDIETESGGIPPADMKNINIQIGNQELTLLFEDPDDTVIDGVTLVQWAGTKVVRKVGSYPVDEKDGVLVLDNTERNKYKDVGFKDTGLVNGTTYYYGFFPYSTERAVNRNTTNRRQATPQPFVTYGVKIDLTNSNPETSIVYTDDAVGKTGGSSEWDSLVPFNQIRPCVLKNGVVQYYLNPNDFTKKMDGTDADITSGNDGDVMIEIPKMAYMIYTEGTDLYVKVTDNPSAKSVDPRYCFNAHSRDVEGDREKLYIGAYLGYDLSDKLRSLSGKKPTAERNIGTFRTQAQANGNGYDLVSFYPLTLLQCLYLIKYKNLDSQSALGRGYVDGNSAATNTGGTNQKGMFFGETTGKQQMKFLGIEDFWGNLRWWIDGLFSDSNRNIKTAFQNFNDTGSGYTDRGQGAISNIGNYMSKPQGTSQTGFIAKEVSGSASTYFCDYAILSASCLPFFGGSWSIASYAGAFYLLVDSSDSDSYSTLGGRLMYL
ncbi:MAG: phage tail protein [Clostridium argentinense]|nr:phage tail protein [Clostridium argentinense]